MPIEMWRGNPISFTKVKNMTTTQEETYETSLGKFRVIPTKSESIIEVKMQINQEWYDMGTMKRNDFTKLIKNKTSLKKKD